MPEPILDQEIEPARPEDFAAVTALLAQSKLPYADLTPDHLRHFLLFRQAGEPVGVVGLELYGEAALLRSLVVAESHRGTGLGRRLVEAVEAHARRQGVRVLYLLTETAEAFFARQGYARTVREGAPANVQQSSEFASVCPVSAACMRKRLG